MRGFDAFLAVLVTVFILVVCAQVKHRHDVRAQLTAGYSHVAALASD